MVFLDIDEKIFIGQSQYSISRVEEFDEFIYYRKQIYKHLKSSRNTNCKDIC
jgi:hypothetical protein